MQEKDSLRREIITFLALTLAFSAVFYILILRAANGIEGAGMLVLGLMWSPGMAALITRRIYHQNLRGLGWAWGRTRYQLLAYFLPLLYALVLYGAVWLFGWGGLSDELSQAGAPEFGYLALMVLVGPLLASLSALGEEIGWRGLLVPQLAKLTGFTQTALISGAIWALWHYPLVIFAGYRNPVVEGSGPPLWFALACFTLTVIGISFVFAWLRLKSGSFWTAMFLHAAHNFYIQSLFAPLTADTRLTPWIAGEFGIGMTVLALLLAWLFWRKRHALPAA